MNREVYKHVLSTFGRRPGIWFAFGAEAVRAFVGRVVTVILLANMVAAVSEGDFETARRLVLLWAALTIAATVLASFGELVGLKTENDEYENRLLVYYKKLTNKDMAFYRDNHTGYLTAMFRQYLDSAIILTRIMRGDVVRLATSLVFPAIVLLITSWKIGLVTVVLVIFQAIYMIWSSAKAKKYREASNEIYRKISGEVADDITNIVAYKAAGKEEEAFRRIKELRKQETAAFYKRRSTVVLLDFPRSILTAVLVAIAFWLALSDSSGAGSTVGLLVLTITYMFQIVRNVSDLPDILYRLDDMVTKMEPTLEVLTDKHESIKDKKDSAKLNMNGGRIEISHLNFAYGSGYQSVFEDLNVVINTGEQVGIVGLSGAGKSTLANLLMRFDDIQEGSILIDGVDVRDMPQSSLRQQIAYVPQEPLLFHRSIRENIAYHNDEATQEDIELAAKAAHAAEFIDELPAGYDTLVGERGVKLSGGQKQRIVIARAILKKAPIILFDEATSALDSESEHIIQQALPEIIGNHTAIIIAHRLSTVAALDRIIVMHKGKIVEEGAHEELLKQKGRYYSLWKRQTAGNKRL